MQRIFLGGGGDTLNSTVPNSRESKEDKRLTSTTVGSKAPSKTPASIFPHYAIAFLLYAV